MTDLHRSLPNRRDALATLIALMGARGVGRALGLLTLGSGSVGEPSRQNPSRSIAEYLSRLEGFGFSGALLVGRDDRILVESAHGLADRSNGLPWQADTIFDTGSVTKQFTAAAILALAADGRLLVSDAMSRYLANVPADKSKITIRQLLTHTAGVEDGFGGDYEAVSRDELVGRALASALRNPPGEQHAYSNVGYSLLAAIVEIVSGMGYDGFVRERLFRRAGMTSSGYELSPSEMRRLARGYRDGEDAGLAEAAAATRGQMWNLIGNGGLYSTIRDLHRWMVALRNDAVLPAEASRELFRAQALVTPNYRDSQSPLHYGYGWYVWTRPAGTTLIWHLGGNGITNAAIRYHVNDRTVVIYASNVSEFHDPSYPVPAVERMLAGSSVEKPPPVEPLTPPELARYAGRYRAPTGGVMTAEARRGFLSLTGEGQEAFTFVAGGEWISDATFRSLNARTMEAVEASRARRFESLARMFPPAVTTGEVEAFESAFWRKRHESLGVYVGTRVLGTMRPSSRRYTGRTVVAIDFERGPTYREYFWLPDGTIGDLGPLRSPPSSRFFPVSGGCFVMFDPAEAKASRLCFAASDGAVVARIEGTPVTLRPEP